MRVSPSLHEGSVRPHCGLFRGIAGWSAIRGFHASTAALLLLVLARFSRQLPLLLCMVIVGLCQGVLLIDTCREPQTSLAGFGPRHSLH